MRLPMSMPVRSRCRLRSDASGVLLRRLALVQIDAVERNVPMRHENLESTLFLAIEPGAIGKELREKLLGRRRARRSGGLDELHRERPVTPAIAVELWNECLDGEIAARFLFLLQERI